MPILNYTTSIDSTKSILEIHSMLTKRNATKVVTDYENGLPIGLTFCINMGNRLVGFSLPCNYHGVLEAMNRDRKVPRNKCTEEQALRVSWRILKDWVAAQCAIVDSRMVTVDEVFFPYAITRNGNIMYKEITDNQSQLLLG